MVNDELPNRILCGTIVIKADVRELREDGSVEFEDGTVVKDVDIVLAATGYWFGFPFIDKSLIEVKQNKVAMFP